MNQESSRPTKKQIMEIALDLIDFELHSEYEDRINALCIDAQTDDGKVFIEKKELDELREKAEAFDFLNSELLDRELLSEKQFGHKMRITFGDWRNPSKAYGNNLLDCVKQVKRLKNHKGLRNNTRPN